VFINSTLFRICAPPVFGILVYLLILLINNTVTELEQTFSNQELYVCMALSLVALESRRLAIHVIDRFDSRLTFGRRVTVQCITTTALSVALVSSTIAAYYQYVVGFSIGTHELNVFAGIFIATALLYNLLYFSHLYLLRENKMQIEMEKKLREKVEADFLSFRHEINPNLLYESLENLILTLHHNADEAEEQIDYLAGIYRYSLINRNKELVSLQEELAATENLIHLLNYRYGRLLNLQINLQGHHDLVIIPGSLLITVDAVVRNTLISGRKPLVIQLYREEDDDYLVLQHTLNDKLLQHEESLAAFSRLQRSYTFFSEQPFVQVKAGKENYIKFPLIRVREELSITA